MSRDKIWEDQAAQWARFARSPQHDHFFWEFNGPRFLELVPAPGRLTVDIGCGEGRLGRLLHERGHRVWALDGSLNLARMAHRSGGQAVIVGDASRLPLGCDSADIVVAFMSLQDLADLDGVVHEVARVLQQGGRFCVAIAHPLRSAGGFLGKTPSSPFQLESYFDARPWMWATQHTGMHLTLPGIHRPLDEYTRALQESAFLIDILREPRPTKHQVAGHGESARWQRIPCFLHIRAIKSGA